MVIFTTGQYAIGFDLQKEEETFKIESEGYSSTAISQKPLVFKDNKILLESSEISTYEDLGKMQAHLSPDRLKLLVVDTKRKVLQVIFLHNMVKLKERAKTIPLESGHVSVSWFSDSEQIVVGYQG